MILEPTPFHPQDAIDLIDCSSAQASFNQMAGPAYSYRDEDGKLLACGGARLGSGEAWLMVRDEVKGGMRKTLLESTKHAMDKIIRERGLWKLFADSKDNGNFLEHVGFREIQAFIWEAGK